MNALSRRSLLLAGSAAAAAPSDRVNVAVVGLRDRGREHIEILGSRPGSHVAAVCDIDQAQTERAVQLGEKVQGAKPRTHQDIRRLLEDEEIDVVSMAACNHWHALGTI
jgi:predicted dehydrogenase